jgi:16S rRNA (guanine527-N7)-methyltransferase
MPLPDGAKRAGLVDGARKLGVALTSGQFEALQGYLALLVRWNRVYNLTAVRDPSEMLVHHVLDCLAVVVPLRGWTRGTPARLLDVGSGAGLPGVVLAVAMPELDVTCIDAVGKKVAFMREVAGSLSLTNLRAKHGRAEDFVGHYDVVASRAFASLADFVASTQHLRDENGVWMAMKGKPSDDELRALPEGVAVFHVEQLTVPGLGAERCLVWMSASR